MFCSHNIICPHNLICSRGRESDHIKLVGVFGAGSAKVAMEIVGDCSEATVIPGLTSKRFGLSNVMLVLVVSATVANLIIVLNAMARLVNVINVPSLL